MKTIFAFFLLAFAFLYVFIASNTLEVKSRVEPRGNVGLGDYTTQHYELHWERFREYVEALPEHAQEAWKYVKSNVR